MGFWDKVARATGIDKELPSMEEEMASDPSAPVALLRAMAEKNALLRPIVRANSSCPPDLAAWIDAHPDAGS